MRWPDEEPEHVRLDVLALLAGYDADASREAGVAITVDQRPCTSAEITLIGRASGTELHIARELRAAMSAADLYPLLRFAAGASGCGQFAAALTALAGPASLPAANLSHQAIDRLRCEQNAAVRAAFRAEILPSLCARDRALAEVVLTRADTAAQAGPPAVRPDVIALLLDLPMLPGSEVHADGRPFTIAERRLLASATDKEWDAAASLQLTDAEITGARAARCWRLHEILSTASRDARLDLAAHLDRHLPPPPLEDGPFADASRYQDEYYATFAAAFRAHVLPGLSPRAQAEASVLLDRLDHGTGS